MWLKLLCKCWCCQVSWVFSVSSCSAPLETKYTSCSSLFAAVGLNPLLRQLLFWGKREPEPQQTLPLLVDVCFGNMGNCFSDYWLYTEEIFQQKISPDGNFEAWETDFLQTKQNNEFYLDHFAISLAVYCPFTLFLFISYSPMRTFCVELLIKLANTLYLFLKAAWQQ